MHVIFIFSRQVTGTKIELYYLTNVSSREYHSHITLHTSKGIKNKIICYNFRNELGLQLSTSVYNWVSDKP